MRIGTGIAFAALSATACGRCGPTPDPGGAVATVSQLAPGSLVLGDCTDVLQGDPLRARQPLYAVDAEGKVTRWLPEGAPPAPGHATVPLPGTTDRGFRSPSGDAFVVKRDTAVKVVRSGAEVTVIPSALVIDAAWSPDGKRIAVAAAHEENGAIRASSLWLANSDGTSAAEVKLPARNPGVLGSKRDAEVPAVAWAPDGKSVFFLSNHESECWSGGRDIPGGCEVGLYRVQADGSALTRRSPRAFQCKSLLILAGP